LPHAQARKRALAPPAAAAQLLAASQSRRRPPLATDIIELDEIAREDRRAA
jgi:hypothetical protein